MIKFLRSSPNLLISVPTAFSMAFDFSIKPNIIPPANTMNIISTPALKPSGIALNMSNTFIGVEAMILYELGTTLLRPSTIILS